MKAAKLMFTTLTLATLGASAAAAPGVEETTAEFESAFNSGNAVQLAELYTVDAIVVAPSQEIVKARSEIRDFWAQKIDTGTSRFRVHAINVREDGASAYQTAAWSATVTSNGKASELYGEMTSILARQADGSCKIQVQNWY